MAWTTRIIKIDHETGEVLKTTEGYDETGYEKILHKLTETHNETILIKKYTRSKQQRIEFK